MSKVGENPIPIPSTVTVDFKDKKVFIKGRYGEIEFILPRALAIKKENNVLMIERSSDSKMTRSLHGLFRSLINNGIIGVEKPWQKRLEIMGTGFNVKLQGEDLILKLGFSHLVTFKKQPGIKYEVEGNNKIVEIGRAHV